MTPEKRVQTKILDLLEQTRRQDKRLEYFRRQAGGASYHDGLPDIWFLYNGLHCEVEVKAPGGHPSPLQLKWEERLTRAGACYWRDDNFDSFEKFFREIQEAVT